jgi:hypothetical protein
MPTLRKTRTLPSATHSPVEASEEEDEDEEEGNDHRSNAP